jgi:electron transport complex protein RnfD
MLQVVYALIPAIAAHAWFFGPGILVQIILAGGFAIGFEALMLKIRKLSLKMYLGDFSALLTAILFALCVPPLAPWWIALCGMFFAIVVAKHLYGGLGYNMFNPAMVGYVVVLVSFPQAMTAWLPPSSIAPYSLGLGDVLITVFHGQPPGELTWDMLTEATPLDSIRTSLASGRMVSEARLSPVFGDFGGLGWEWIANWYALGGFWLLWRRIISWHVPATMIGSVVVLGLIAYLTDPGSNPAPLQHDRSCKRVHELAGQADFRRRCRDHHPGHSPLGRLPGRRGLRCADDEYGGAADRPVHPAKDFWPMNSPGCGQK